MPPVKPVKRGISDTDDKNEEYMRNRERNNEAVKKSRYKAKQRTQETFTRVSELKEENERLEVQVNSLTKELQFLKELFMAHASNTQSAKFEGVDLDKLLEDVPEDKNISNSKS